MGDTHIENSYFSVCAIFAIYVIDGINSMLKVEGNTITDAGGGVDEDEFLKPMIGGAGLIVGYMSDCSIVIKNNLLINTVGYGIAVSGVVDSWLRIYDNEISYHEMRGPINLAGITTTLVKIEGNSIRHYSPIFTLGTGAAIRVMFCEEMIFRDNEFIDIGSTEIPARAVVLLILTVNCILEDNDYTQSGKLSSCILLGSGSDNNVVKELRFPVGTTVFEQVVDYGTNNNIFVDDN
jgi:hypothetical protein